VSASTRAAARHRQPSALHRLTRALRAALRVPAHDRDAVADLIASQLRNGRRADR